MRYITRPDDTYGLTKEALRERLVLITGKQELADDAMAAIAEWLDTVWTKANDWIDATEPQPSEYERAMAVSHAGGFVQALSVEAEGLVSDSLYGLVDDSTGQRVRRRILTEEE